MPSVCRVYFRTSGFILDPRTIPDRCVASERGCIASQLWVVGCNPLFETPCFGCFPARKVRNAPKYSGNRDKRAVRPHFLGFTRIFSILLPPGMLVAAQKSGFAWHNADFCAFPYLLRLCMPALPLSIRRFQFERQRSGDDPQAVLHRCAACARVCIAAACGSYPATPCSALIFIKPGAGFRARNSG